jgi:hypothetical protein
MIQKSIRYINKHIDYYKITSKIWIKAAPNASYAYFDLNEKGNKYQILVINNNIVFEDTL